MELAQVPHRQTPCAAGIVRAAAEVKTRAGCGGGGGSAGCVVMKLGVISRLTVTETGGDFQISTAFGGVG
jgi:hypothetical protein